MERYDKANVFHGLADSIIKLNGAPLEDHRQIVRETLYIPSEIEKRKIESLDIKDIRFLSRIVMEIDLISTFTNTLRSVHS